MGLARQARTPRILSHIEYSNVAGSYQGLAAPSPYCLLFSDYCLLPKK